MWNIILSKNTDNFTSSDRQIQIILPPSLSVLTWQPPVAQPEDCSRELFE